MSDCKFESVISGQPVGNPPSAPETPVDTDIDTSETDTENLDDHIRDLALSSASNDGVSVSTEWPGSSSPVVTPRASGETVRDWLTRHKGNCAAALAANPIDC